MNVDLINDTTLPLSLLCFYPSLVQMFKEWLYSSGPNTNHICRYFTGAVQDNASQQWQCSREGVDGDTGIVILDYLQFMRIPLNILAQRVMLYTRGDGDKILLDNNPSFPAP